MKEYQEKMKEVEARAEEETKKLRAEKEACDKEHA